MSGPYIARTMRLFVDPEPTSGPHPGYRGPMLVDALGIHITTECEYLPVDDDLDPDVEWEAVEVDCLIPWHRVFLIEYPTRRAA